MNTPVSAETVGEGFAFFHWMINVIYPKRICDPGRGGWACKFCRERWQRPNDKDSP